jgi:CheY-like chemotaxis protein
MCPIEHEGSRLFRACAAGTFVRILVVDDNLSTEDIRYLFKARLTVAGPIVNGDEEAWRKMVRARLRQAGFELDFATNGDEALARFRQNGPYDLVLTDLYHPGLDGIDLARTIRRENPAQAIAVFTIPGVPDSVLEACWKLCVPVGYKLDEWDALRRLVEDAVARNGERLANRNPGTVQ